MTVLATLFLADRDEDGVLISTYTGEVLAEPGERVSLRVWLRPRWDWV